MVDTRAGFWLQLIVAVVTLAAVVLFCIFGDTEELIFRDMFALAITPASDPAADRRHPARELGVVAADRADHLHARPASGCG